MKHIIPQAIEVGNSLVQCSFAPLVLFEVSGSDLWIDLLELVEWIKNRTGQVARNAMIDETCSGITSG